MKNPTAASKENINIGKSLWKTHCKSCHGTFGEGDGTKADGLDTEMDDFTTSKVQSQTDGELFYKLTEGRDEMPNFKKKLPDDEDRWLLVHYIRTVAE